MVHLFLRLACLSLASIVYQAQAAPVEGDVRYMQPVLQLGAGGQANHPHIEMGAVTTPHPLGHDIVVAPVTHSASPILGHSIPVPANQPGIAPHGLSGNVLQMETAHSANTHIGGRFANSNVDAPARHTIAAHQHTVAAGVHTNAAVQHTNAAQIRTAIGDHPQAALHANSAAHHTNMAAVHTAESHNHALAAVGQPHGPIHMPLEHVTPSKMDAHASAQGAAQSAHDAAFIQAHEHAAGAHMGAAQAHNGAAMAHTAAANRFHAAGQYDVAAAHHGSAVMHAGQEHHHLAQAAAHVDPIMRNNVDPHLSHQAATNSHAGAVQSLNAAHHSHPAPPAHHAQQPPHNAGGPGGHDRHH